MAAYGTLATGSPWLPELGNSGPAFLFCKVPPIADLNLAQRLVLAHLHTPDCARRASSDFSLWDLCLAGMHPTKLLRCYGVGDSRRPGAMTTRAPPISLCTSCTRSSQHQWHLVTSVKGLNLPLGLEEEHILL